MTLKSRMERERDEWDRRDSKIEAAYLEAANRWQLSASKRKEFVASARTLQGYVNDITIESAFDGGRRFVARDASGLLRNIAKLAESLREKLLSLPIEVVEAIEGEYPAALIKKDARPVSRTLSRELDFLLDDLADTARNIDCRKVPHGINRAGAPPKSATKVAARVANDIQRATGKRLDVSADANSGVRGVAPLVRKIFAIFDIQADPRAALTASINQRA